MGPEVHNCWPRDVVRDHPRRKLSRYQVAAVSYENDSYMARSYHLAAMLDAKRLPTWSRGRPLMKFVVSLTSSMTSLQRKRYVLFVFLTAITSWILIQGANQKRERKSHHFTLINYLKSPLGMGRRPMRDQFIEFTVPPIFLSSCHYQFP